MMSDPQKNMLSADVAANLTDMNYVFGQGSWLTTATTAINSAML